IRHTVGLADPLTADDVPAEKRLDDGLPETLEEYIRRDGIRYFKVKVSGDPAADIRRLSRVWDVVVKADKPVVTLDANESYPDLERFAKFVRGLEDELLGLFQHIAYIEQPLPRALTLDGSTAAAIRKIGEIKPLLIDEADGTLDAFERAHRIGYQGVSHKNCKGVFKSLLNQALAARHRRSGRRAFLSAEDLQALPVVPLHQDFAVVAALGLEHCERNGHHYNHGLRHLSPKDRASVARHHRDLYIQRDDEWFLNIRSGAVECGSLECPGLGIRDEPDFASMSDLRRWVDRRFPG
ncbi:MAG: mandelate racemase, partial [Planctomycetota bacterium]|nr:mandelate racemase [Planctomycetota bacterium]